ncbi:MAG: RsmB/NOP family class I SAM-dependent RNA methyltransferase [Desulfurococcales archaeon]|nr:RsmB/NOP family class I SAM-dependent RNA methyltransferase [Desulfurococcales archaeon]
MERKRLALANITVSRTAIRLAKRYGYLPYMVQRYIDMLGVDEAEKLLRANEEPYLRAIRCNDYLIDCDKLVERLSEKGIVLEPIPYTRTGFAVKMGSDKIGFLHEYMLGYYYIQDPASMLPVESLDPRPNETILDGAAAPGGKATQIQQYTKDESLLVAVDVSRERMRALRSHLARMGFYNAILIRTDLRRLPDALGVQLFDKILLDAPCSGEGIVRRDPSRKTSRTLDDLLFLSDLQYELSTASYSMLKQGGIFVYSTCSIGVEENEFVIDRLLRRFPDLEPLEQTIPGVAGIDEYRGIKFDPRLKKCRRLYPHIHNTEGFFICKIKKKD